LPGSNRMPENLPKTPLERHVDQLSAAPETFRVVRRPSEDRLGWPGIPEATRRVMRGNRSKDTAPERLVRSLAHSMGYRFRTHAPGLPGTPDIAFTARRKAIWVHGCFWHRHDGCRFATTPRTRAEYWLPKLARNVARDAFNADAIREMGWQAIVIWECELKDDLDATRTALRNFLGPRRVCHNHGGSNPAS
jgi:DNA mismatch endonuclease, patch repair protein